MCNLNRMTLDEWEEKEDRERAQRERMEKRIKEMGEEALRKASETIA